MNKKVSLSSWLGITNNLFFNTIYFGFKCFGGKETKQKDDYIYVNKQTKLSPFYDAGYSTESCACSASAPPLGCSPSVLTLFLNSRKSGLKRNQYSSVVLRVAQDNSSSCNAAEDKRLDPLVYSTS